MPFEIKIEIDPKGIYFDPQEPPHLDDLLYWAEFMRIRGHSGELEQWQAPPMLDLGLEMREIFGSRVYCASSLVPQEPFFDTVQYWRKKPVERRYGLFAGSLNSVQGPYRAYNTPISVKLCNTLTGYFSGNPARVDELMGLLRGIGKKSAYGYGKIRKYTIIERNEDYSLHRDGIAMRWLPNPAGYRTCRPVPPYWHSKDCVQMGEVGEELF